MAGHRLAGPLGMATMPLLSYFLDEGATIESEEEYGQTPLSWAVQNGHGAVVKLLLDKGASIESKDEYYGQTPLGWAAETSYNVVVKLLLEKGAAIESKDEYGNKRWKFQL